MRQADAEERDWMAGGAHCPAPGCDVLVTLADSVYIGPPNGMTPAQWRGARIPLPPPDLPCRWPGRLASADLPGREPALAAHYAGIARILATHGRPAEARQPFPYASLRPAIFCGDRLLADWPWSDSLPEAAATLQQLAGAAEMPPGRVLLDEQDQGWRLLMLSGQDGMLHLLEWDAEGAPPPGTAWHLPAAPLARQAAAALERVRASHARLRRLLGRDPWG